MTTTAYRALEVSKTTGVCPIGETVGKRNREEGLIPVLSCEGACIRGEIARQAANLVGRQVPFSRACHGELLAVPHSQIAGWVMDAPHLVVIDGCFLRCHGRILENLLPPEKLIQFDALSHYNKYTDKFYVDDVPPAEREETIQSVATWVLDALQNFEPSEKGPHPQPTKPGNHSASEGSCTCQST